MMNRLPIARMLVPALAGVILMMVLGAGADGTIKIATADLKKIFTEMAETKDIKSKFQADGSAHDTAKAQKQAEIDAMKKDLSILKADSPAAMAKSQDILQKSIEFNVWDQMTTRDIDRRQKQELTRVYGEIQAAIDQVAKDKGYNLVLADIRPELPDIDQTDYVHLDAAISQRTVLYNDRSADISEAVLAQLDKKYKEGH